MDKTDARTQSPQTQYELRKQVIRLRKKGITNRETAQIVGINVTSASTIWQAFLRGGLEAIKPKPLGRKLTTEQEAAIQRLLVDKTPDQLKLPFALWTCNAVRMAIRERFRIDMPLRTISDYLKRWGFAPQKPVKRTSEQNPKKVMQWLETEYPAITARARQEKPKFTGVTRPACRTTRTMPGGLRRKARLQSCDSTRKD